MKPILALSLIFLAGCTSSETVKKTEAPVPTEAAVKPNDPDAKIVKAYELVESGQVIAGEKLFQEVVATAKTEKDPYLEAHGLTGLGDVYSYNPPPRTDGAVAEKLLNYKKAGKHYEEAAAKLMEISYTKHAAITYYGAAEAYKNANETKKSCDLYVKAAKVYDMVSKKDQDQLQPEVEAGIGTILKLFKKKNYEIECLSARKK